MKRIWEEGTKYCYAEHRLDYGALRDEAVRLRRSLLAIGDDKDSTRPYRGCAAAALAVSLQMHNCGANRSATFMVHMDDTWKHHSELCKKEIDENDDI
ncbi:hypothetical protein [Luteibacter yeojuensis]|uniref:hypothetical protein n=1 Tax=Luteibacter yeojuensis TaxID=345309 RepID=UPI0012ED2B71|nr:hypothetical protein [Luteibacter yeojuensis]